MPTTSRGYRYPAGTANIPPDVRGDLQNLATDVNTDVGAVSTLAGNGGTDTGWSLSGISLSSGWDTKTDPNGNTSGTLTGGVRKIGSMVTLSFRGSRNGGTVSGGSQGNISPDQQIATITATTHRPASVKYGTYAVPGVAQGQCAVDPSGNVRITTISNGATIPNNTPLQVDIVYPVG